MALPNWMPNISQCKCVLVYTDLRHMKSPASLAHEKPEQQYDPHGHYACSGCHKDYKFDGPYYHPRLMLDTIMDSPSTATTGWTCASDARDKHP